MQSPDRARLVAGTGKQFGGNEQMSARAASGALHGEKCDGIRAAAQAVDQD
jgi:hypothetical protein